MAGELPVFKRCCFCLPLRYGLIAWGYFKLGINALMIMIMSIAIFYSMAMAPDRVPSSLALYLIVTGLAILILFTDLALSIVFIIGGHKKNVKMLRIYYIHSIVIWILMILFAVAITGLYIHDWIYYFKSMFWCFYVVVDCSNFIAIILVQGYMLLLMRSEIMKLRNNCEFRFVNHAAEAECSMVCEEKIKVDADEGKETSRLGVD